MGFRRRTRRRALIAGAAIAHHEDKKYAEQDSLMRRRRMKPGAGAVCAASGRTRPTEIEHFAELHASGVLTDEEFAAAKAKALGS